MLTRNDKILLTILRGYSLRQVGSAYNICAERAKQVAMDTAKKYNRRLRLAGLPRVETGSITGLRKYKNMFIRFIIDSNQKEVSGG